MKVNARNLPRLNLCYIQKKAYQIHQQKLRRATSSLSLPHKSHTKNARSLTRPNNYIAIIPEGPIFNHNARAVASRRKLNYLTKKQNDRLSVAIQRCSPTIKHRDLTKHQRKDIQDLARMNRFKIDPNSHKKILKCEYSLEKLIQEKKRKTRLMESRIYRLNPVSRYSERKDQSHQMKLDVEMPLSTSHKKAASTMKNQENRFKGAIARNLEKIRNYFQNKNYESLTEQRLQGFRQKMPSRQKHTLAPQIHRWKTRCFTTQIQQYP